MTNWDRFHFQGARRTVNKMLGNFGTTFTILGNFSNFRQLFFYRANFFILRQWVNYLTKKTRKGNFKVYLLFSLFWSHAALLFWFMLKYAHLHHHLVNIYVPLQSISSLKSKAWRQKFSREVTGTIRTFKAARLCSPMKVHAKALPIIESKAIWIVCRCCDCQVCQKTSRVSTHCIWFKYWNRGRESWWSDHEMAFPS